MEKSWCLKGNVDLWIGDGREKTGIYWKRKAMDGVITKVPLGGKKHRTKSHRQSESQVQNVGIREMVKEYQLGVRVDGVNST